MKFASCVYFLILLLSVLVQQSEQYRFTGQRKVYTSRYSQSMNPLHVPSLRCQTRLQMGALENSPLELCEENAQLVIEEVRKELGTIFGYDPASQAVGITGKIELVEVDGPSIIVSLSGRFWHATDTVMMRVESFIKQRIPEVIDVTLSMEKSSIQDDNRLNTDGGRKLF